MRPRNDTAFFDQLHALFTALQPDEVEQFYAAYRQWLLQQRIVELRQRLAATQEELVRNEQRIQQVHPSSIALASLARLQANGVSDVEVLDAMHERGEAWLDATMQRLDYCEQFENFLTDGYTQWARLALDGAFDWIDSALTPAASETPLEQPETAPGAEDAGETEAQFLHILTTEADDDDLSWQASTLKQSAIFIPQGKPALEELPSIEAPALEMPHEQEVVEPETSESQNAPDEEIAQAESKPIPPIPSYVPQKQRLSRRLIGKLLGE